MARMPEANTATRQGQWTAAVLGAWIRRPALRGVKVAEGAQDTWSKLGETLPCGAEGVDFYHAAAPLGAALGAADGAGTPTDRDRGEPWRPGRRDAPQGGGPSDGGPVLLADALSPPSGDTYGAVVLP
jgi:hypothetical protein